MGAGIAQLAIEAGSVVLLNDVDAAAIERGRARIRTGLERRAGRLDLDPESADAWIEGRIDRLRDAPSLADLAAAQPDLVVEAALEDLEAKRVIVRELDRLVLPTAIIATNTSAISVASIAEAAAPSGPRPGSPFLQPRAGHAPRRGGRRPDHGPGGRRARDRPDDRVGQGPGPLH